MTRKTVLVTGASRGIGKAIALRFAKENYHIAISCIHSADRLAETKAEIEACWAGLRAPTEGGSPDGRLYTPAEDGSPNIRPRGMAKDGSPDGTPRGTAQAAAQKNDRGQSIRTADHTPVTGYSARGGLPAGGPDMEEAPPVCLTYVGDMGDMACCREFFAQITERLGHVDVLVNNAGISHIGLLQDMTCEEWDRVIRTNLTSAFNLCRLVIPGMVSRKSGKIINISSVWGNVGASCEAAYSASKGGLNALTRALAKELAPSGIQVNAIACGAIDTEMNHFLDDEEMNRLTEQIPAGRLGTAEETAELVWQLAQNNTYLTGQVIGLDGGWI